MVRVRTAYIIVSIQTVVLTCWCASAPSAWLAAGLKAHNAYRLKHSAPKLSLDQKLTAYAQAYADKLASKGVFAHNPEAKYGENLFATIGDPLGTVTAAVDSWYSEVKSYNYSVANVTNPDYFLKVGHFTQLVWKSSQRLGLGLATNATTKWTYVVANYDPPGNVLGVQNFVLNVAPPK